MSERARIQRLRAEVRSDREAAFRRFDELERIQLDEAADPGELARAAIALHHGYGAIEALLARVMRGLGETEPGGAEWHQSLLHASGLEIDGVRPALLREESIRRLRKLLAFRHFFRHAYTITLDWAQLAALREDVLALRPWLDGDLDQLDAFLLRLAELAGS